jgi:hypothetical protein
VIARGELVGKQAVEVVAVGALGASVVEGQAERLLEVETVGRGEVAMLVQTTVVPVEAQVGWRLSVVVRIVVIVIVRVARVGDGAVPPDERAQLRSGGDLRGGQQRRLVGRRGHRGQQPDRGLGQCAVGEGLLDATNRWEPAGQGQGTSRLTGLQAALPRHERGGGAVEGATALVDLADQRHLLGLEPGDLR